MKRTAEILIAAMLGTCLAVPVAIAQSYQDMQHDRGDIGQSEHAIRHDHQELRHDMRNGDHGAAQEERGEIHARNQQLRNEKRDLRHDRENRNSHHDDDRD